MAGTSDLKLVYHILRCFEARTIERRNLLPKVIADRFRLTPGYDCRERGRIGLLHRLHAAEVFEKTPGCALANAGDLQ